MDSSIPQKRKPGSLFRALDYLQLNIKKGTWKKGDRIPTIKELAVTAGVGRPAMEQAVACLQKKKTLVAQRKTGIFVGSTIPKKQPLPSTRPTLKWHILRDQIKRDIYEGQFSATGNLPPSKELLFRYGVDFRTLKKALAFLTDDDPLLKRQKHRYHIHTHNTATNKTLHFIMSENLYMLITYSDTKQLIVDFIRELEQECSIREIQLIKQAWSTNLHIEQPATTIGFVVWYDTEMSGIYENILASLKQFGKPIAFFPIEQRSQESTFRLFEFFSKHTGVFFNNPERGFKAGVEMGRFLFNKGYKKLCFLSHFNVAIGEYYYKGICQVYNSIGLLNAVVPLYLADLSGPELQKYYTEKDRTFEKSIQTELNFLEHCETDMTTVRTRQLGKRLMVEVQETRFRLNQRTFLTPLFRKALTYPDVTAWVCYDDFLACHGALEFLKAEGINVPQHIGVVGCNDLTEASMNNLTTYHFDYAGVVRKMISLLMYPEHSRKSLCIKGTNMFEVDGMVIDRGSA